MSFDSALLEKELKQALTCPVHFDRAYQALYATDASNYRQIPIGVVFPQSEEDILKTIEICRKYQVPILSRGAGTSLAGQCCNTAVIMDMSRFYNKILSIDSVNRTARIQPGIVLDELRRAASAYGLTFGPDPASHSRCTLGGMIGNNSCGVHALTFGKTVQNIRSLKIATYDGLVLEVGPTSKQLFEQLIQKKDRTAHLYQGLRHLAETYGPLVRERFPKIPRRVSGYNLDELLPENEFNVARALVGSEGTCVTVLEATVELVPQPQDVLLVVLGFESVYEAADAVPLILSHSPHGLEGIDDDLVSGWDANASRESSKAILPPGNGWLLVEIAGNSRDINRFKTGQLIQAVSTAYPTSSSKVCETEWDSKRVWKIRESALALTAFVPGQRPRYEGWEDAAVAPEKLGAYLRDYKALCKTYNYESALYGHFGDGCLHTRVSFDLLSPEGIETSRRFLNDAADLVIRYGGSLSGEHGDGQARAELLPKMFGPELIEAFEKFKALWDPTYKMNPGKLVKANRMTDNLRLQKEDFEGRFKTETFFHYKNVPSFRSLGATPSPQGEEQLIEKTSSSFSKELIQCVGVGACRKEDAGTMCPSYKATRDEKHSTRGRAHLLFEMLRGEVIQTGWKSEEVKESLEMCLACKACQSECPTQIDMATYKAEFLAHYYEHHPRPLRAYAFGFIFKWLRVLSRGAKLVNLITRSPLSFIGKFILGIHPKRSLPLLAHETFHSWFNKQAPTDASSPKPTVLLWTDTFSNYYDPHIAQAAYRVLTKFGFNVQIPKQLHCCGRPLYDYGFLKEAKALLTSILSELNEAIQQKIPIIVLEPSCASVFRDELLRFFPNDPNAKALAEQTFLLSEFILQQAPKMHAVFPPIKNIGTHEQVYLEPHCHEESLKMSHDEKLLAFLKIPSEKFPAGCCGMAGPFGYEKDHYAVSMACADQTIAPVIEQAPKTSTFLANGFSCRNQIKHLSDAPRIQHIAELLDKHLE